MPEIIRIALSSTLPRDTVNMYLIKDNPLTLIDSGFNNAETRDTLEMALRAHHLRLTDIKRVVLTHTHPDHVGLAAAIQTAAGASVHLHPREWEKIRAGQADNNHILHWAGIPADILATTRRGGPQAVRYPQAVEFLVDGDTVQFATHAWQVIHVPGHSTGLINLYNPAAQHLFTGDHLVPDFSPALLVEPDGTGGRTPSYDQYLASLARVEGLPVREVFPGHGDPSYDFTAMIARQYVGHARKLEKLATLLTDAPQTVFAFVRALNPEIRGFIVFFAAGDTLAHLDKLVALGKATAEDKDGVLYFRRKC